MPGRASMVTFNRDPHGLTSVYAVFDERWLDRLSVLRRGDHIEVIGQIKDIGYKKIDLEPAELVD
jgi:hypothetical protein